jgi:hypothetical protein
MHLSIEEFKTLDNNLLLMKNLTDFALKEEYKHLLSVWERLAQIDS